MCGVDLFKIFCDNKDPHHLGSAIFAGVFFFVYSKNLNKRAIFKYFSYRSTNIDEHTQKSFIDYSINSNEYLIYSQLSV